MNAKSDGILSAIAASGLEKCLLKMNRASSGKWELAGARVFTGRIPEAIKLRNPEGGPSSAVQINVDNSPRFAAVLVFGSGDINHISRCFVNDDLSRARGIERFEEVMLVEIGNILLNALINSLLNSLKRSAVPSVPMHVSGGTEAITDGLGAFMDLNLNYRIIALAVNIRRDGHSSRAEILAILPEELAADLEPA